jgi:hypothetical protein
MYGAAIIFLMLLAIFGLNVFRITRWLVFGGILVLIVLFVVAEFVPPPKPAAQVTPSPTPGPQVVLLPDVSSTPEVLTQQEESQLFDYNGLNN